ncbi:MAG: 3-methyl-2-oxobutanoate hydroxymethyltransferase, partial [Marivivens sp.]|nr:3-methyl-2-oxobutanoate hydroxymethyltransferase [Marivivens sp.]
MGMYHNRPHVEDLRKMKKNGEKISMLYVTTLEEAAAAAAAGIHMLSIEGRFFDNEMREAAGDCFVQVGLPFGGWGSFNGRPLATAEDYLRA